MTSRIADWLLRGRGGSAAFWLFALVCALPVVGSLIGRVLKGRVWLVDLDAILCAAEQVSRGQSPYGSDPVCEGLTATRYVYAPQFAELLAAPVSALGHDTIKILYCLMLVAALAYVVRITLLRDLVCASFRVRLLGFSLLTGSAFASGNIGLLLNAAVIAAAFSLKRRPLLFIIVVAACAVIKPHMLTLLVVKMLLDQPIAARIKTSAQALAIGLGALALIWTTAGPLRPDWIASAFATSVSQQPGLGYLAWIGLAPVTTTPALTWGAYAAFAGLLTLCGMGIVTRTRASFEQRVVIGLLIGILCNPRPMDYDLLVLPLSGAALVACLGRAGLSMQRTAVLGYAAICLATFLMHEANVKLFGPDPMMLLAVSLFVAGCSGAMELRKRASN